VGSSTKISSSSTKTSSPGYLERASGSSLFYPGTCSTSKLNRFNSMAHQVSFPLSSWILSSHVRAVLSVRRVQRLSASNDLYFFSAHTTAWHSCSLEWYFDSADVNFAEAKETILRSPSSPLQEETLCWIWSAQNEWSPEQKLDCVESFLFNFGPPPCFPLSE
jgi:hypothetical protein